MAIQKMPAAPQALDGAGWWIGLWNSVGINRPRSARGDTFPNASLLTPELLSAAYVVPVHLSANRDEVELKQLS